MATVAFILYRCDSLAMLHTFLYLILRPNAVTESVTAKGVLWTILFGLAKTCQYGGLTILGVEGYKRLKRFCKKTES